MKRFPRHVIFKILFIKFLINNNKKVNFIVCQDLRDLYNWRSPFRKGGVVQFSPAVNLHRCSFGTRDHHGREQEYCSRLCPCEENASPHQHGLPFVPRMSSAWLSAEERAGGCKSETCWRHHRWLSPTSYSLEISSFALLHSTDCTLNSYLQFGAVSSSDFWLPSCFLPGPDARSLLRGLILRFFDGTEVSLSYCRVLHKSSTFNVAFMTDLFIHWVMNGKENCFSLFYWVMKGKIALLYLTAQPLLKIAPDYIFSGSLFTIILLY